jgi:hypothetical protein
MRIERGTTRLQDVEPFRLKRQLDETRRFPLGILYIKSDGYEIPTLGLNK